MKFICLARCLFLVVGFTALSVNAAIELFPSRNVQLQDGPFYRAQSLDKAYVMALDVEKLLAPFRREAGLPFGESYGNWESSGLDGHIGGHYISALALLYAATEDDVILQRLNYVIAELKKCQDKNGNGYLGGIPEGEKAWQALSAGNVQVDNFSLNGKWVPWYNLHKVFAGLRDAYLIANHEDAKLMLIKLSDWAIAITAQLSDEQMEAMLRSEHGGMNEIFVDVADITGDKKYLAAARRFSHNLLLNPLLQAQDDLTGMHANTQIPKVIGFKRFADATNNKAWNDAARYFWETVVEKRSVAIGGNSVKEHFHDKDSFQSMIDEVEGPETCNTYNMLKLSKLLYLSSGELKYLEYYERALYNHILSSQHPNTGGLVYFTPMRPNHYRVYSQVQDAMWCCVGSGIESHAKYNELIYTYNQDQLYINLFISSRLYWPEKNIHITQETLFPDVANTQLRIHSAGKFTLNLRYPSWVEEGALNIRVNGKAIKVTAKPGHYVAIARHWREGDEVRFEVPMTTRLEPLPDHSDYYAVMHGPIALAAKTQPFMAETLSYFADDSRMGHVAQGKVCPLEAAPVFVTDNKDFVASIKPITGRPLTFSVPVVVDKQEKNMELIPFFRLHDSRYMLYWPMSSRVDLSARQLATASAERQSLMLDARTIDALTPGQQQPESDHFLQSDRSEMGIHLGRHWRHAEGWFSYRLRDKKQEATTLQLTFFSGDAGRKFSLVINGTEIADIELQKQEPGFYELDYAIPASVIAAAESGVLEVKFLAKAGSIAGGIYGVRLLRK